MSRPRASRSKMKAPAPSRSARAEAFSRIIDVIEHETDEVRMSAQDYRELLGELVAELEDRLGAANNPSK